MLLKKEKKKKKKEKKKKACSLWEKAPDRDLLLRPLPVRPLEQGSPIACSSKKQMMPILVSKQFPKMATQRARSKSLASSSQIFLSSYRSSRKKKTLYRINEREHS